LKHGIADLSDPMLNDRISELKATRDQAHLAAEAQDAIERGGPSITSGACRRIGTYSGGYRRDHLRALTQRVEVDQKELRFMEPARLALASFFAPAPRRSPSLKTRKFPAKSRFVRILADRAKVA
jgi:site-specific DNA recombinase